MKQNLQGKLYDVLEARGDPYERGFEYGSHHKALIRRLLDSHFSYYVKYLGFDKDSVVREASLFEEPIKTYSDSVYQEVRGMADGAGLKLDEILVLSAFNEVFYPKLSKLCTSFAVRGSATADGLTYIGQNNDEGIDPWLDGECVVLVRNRQRDAPDVLTYTYAGVPAMMGINSSGVALCINALRFEAPRVGVPMLVITRELLNQKDLEGAINSIKRANRAYSLNFMIGSPEGIVDVEATPNQVYVTSSNEALYHANHYLCPVDGYAENRSGDYYKNSSARCDRMAELIKVNLGKHTLNTLMDVLRDHGGVHTICSHPRSDVRKERRSRTLDGMIYIPEKREAWIARGNPCKSVFQRYVV
ncbi:MAG: C45 family peptidase [Thermoprotei archaeon]